MVDFDKAVSDDALIDQLALLVSELQRRKLASSPGERLTPLSVKESKSDSSDQQLSPSLQPDRPSLYPHKPQAALSILKRSDLGQEFSEALKLPKFEG